MSINPFELINAFKIISKGIFLCIARQRIIFEKCLKKKKRTQK